MSVKIEITNRKDLPNNHANYTFDLKIGRTVFRGDILNHNRREGWPGLLRDLVRQLNRSQKQPINVIWTITVIKDLNTLRPVGWYFLKEDAIRAVEKNDLDINESLSYPYAVIECSGQGVYCDSYKQIWFKWKGSEQQGSYVKLNRIPKKFKNVCSWAIG